MVFNNRMNWNDHVNMICEKIYRGLRSAWPQFVNIPQMTRVMFAKSLLMPHFDYCSIVYSYGLNSGSKALLDRAFHSIIRFAYGVRKYDSVSNFTDRLLGFDLEKFFKVRAMCYLFKQFRSRLPQYLNFIVETGNSSRTNQLTVPRHYSQQYRNTIMVKGVVDWNSLPCAVRGLSSYYLILSLS